MSLKLPRVLLLTADSAYSRLFINSFLTSAEVEPIGLVLSTATLKRGQTGLAALWTFVRTVGLGYALYQAYVCCILPWLKGLKPYREVPVFRTDDVNTSETVSWIKALEPEFLLSFHFNQKLLHAVIGIPGLTALNFHPSYLPAWRGVDPVLFALQAQDSVLGGSIHCLTDQIDRGDVLLREKLSHEHVAGLIKTNAALFTLGGRMAAGVIKDFDAFNRQRMAQRVLPVRDVEDRYDGWSAVGRLGLVGLWKALWANPRKTS